jgi:formyl-CoA transferase
MSTRVLEFGGLAAGFCGRLFRHGGAEVIRIEGAVPSVTDAWVSQGAVDAFLHAGKQRVAFRGRDQLLELAGSVDVVVAEGMPEELEALGWDAIDGIRVAITPFGMTGPRRQWHASASVLLAMGGYTYLMGDPGRAPLTLPGHYTEFQSGQYAYIGTSACLYEGQDHSLDVSMLEVVLSLSQMTTVMWSCNGDVRSRHGSSFGILYPINLFPCADGWFHVNVVPHFWGPFTEMLGRPDLEGDVRFASSRGRIDNKDELDRIIFESLGHRTKAEVQKLGEQARVPTGVLQEIDEVLADPHLAERNIWCDINGMQSPSLAYRFDGDLPNDFIVEPIDG